MNDMSESGTANAPPLSNWGVFEPNGELGTLNYLTADVVHHASRCIRTGERFTLNLPLNVPTNPETGTPWFKPDGPRFERVTFRHAMRGKPTPGGVPIVSDDAVTFSTQGSSQWDAFIHAGIQEEGSDAVFWNGVGLDAIDATGFPHKNAIDKVAKAGIVGRGVLLDIARFVADGRPDPLPLDHIITPDQTLACIKAEDLDMLPGDIVCYRTGWTERLIEADVATQKKLCSKDNDGHFPKIPGINGEHAAIAHRQKWAAVTADNIGVDYSPLGDFSKSAHVTMQRNLGVIFGEMLIFQDLAKACAADRRWEFFFVAVPLYIPGGMGSPANAIAIR